MFDNRDLLVMVDDLGRSEATAPKLSTGWNVYLAVREAGFESDLVAVARLMGELVEVGLVEPLRPMAGVSLPAPKHGFTDRDFRISWTIGRRRKVAQKPKGCGEIAAQMS